MVWLLKSPASYNNDHGSVIYSNKSKLLNINIWWIQTSLYKGIYWSLILYLSISTCYPCITAWHRKIYCFSSNFIWENIPFTKHTQCVCIDVLTIYANLKEQYSLWICSYLCFISIYENFFIKCRSFVFLNILSFVNLLKFQREIISLCWLFYYSNLALLSLWFYYCFKSYRGSNNGHRVCN